MNQLGDLLARLTESQVEFVLVGGYAAIVHGATQVTEDVDICLRFSPENLRRLDSALKDLDPKHRMTPQKLPLQITPDSAREWKNIYLETNWGVVDCLGEVLGIGDYDAVAASSIAFSFPFGECLVLGAEALIRAKLAMGRPHDLQTVKQLQAIRQSRRE